MNILVTGANGFIGSILCRRLADSEHKVKGAIRQMKSSTSYLPGVDFIAVGDIKHDTDWTQALIGIDVIIHLAARVHMMKDNVTDPLAEFRMVNTSGTARLARMAATAGVKRLVYISSIKVNGEMTIKTPFTEENMPNPPDSYAISKLEAEQEIQKIASGNGLEFVIIRPPLVYGPGVGANLLRLMRMIDSGVPVPLGSNRNSRSLIYVGNLVDAIVKCIEHPSAANEIFLVSDGEDLSTPELIRRMAKSLGKPDHLIPCPLFFLGLAGALIGKSAEVKRLTSSLVIDSTKIRRELEWVPPFTVDEGLRHTAEWYRSNEKKF